MPLVEGNNQPLARDNTVSSGTGAAVNIANCALESLFRAIAANGGCERLVLSKQQRQLFRERAMAVAATTESGGTIQNTTGSGGNLWSPQQRHLAT